MVNSSEFWILQARNPLPHQKDKTDDIKQIRSTFTGR